MKAGVFGRLVCLLQKNSVFNQEYNAGVHY